MLDGRIILPIGTASGRFANSGTSALPNVHGDSASDEASAVCALVEKVSQLQTMVHHPELHETLCKQEMLSAVEQVTNTATQLTKFLQGVIGPTSRKHDKPKSDNLFKAPATRDIPQTQPIFHASKRRRVPKPIDDQVLSNSKEVVP